jgi:hypothetical protein
MTPAASSPLALRPQRWKRRMSTEATPATAMARGDDGRQVERRAEGVAVGVEEAGRPWLVDAGGERFKQGGFDVGGEVAAGDADLQLDIERDMHRVGRIPSRSQPAGSVRGRLRMVALNAASTGLPSRRSSIRKTVYQLPVQHRRAAARCTSGWRSAARA